MPAAIAAPAEPTPPAAPAWFFLEVMDEAGTECRAFITRVDKWHSATTDDGCPVPDRAGRVAARGGGRLLAQDTSAPHDVAAGGFVPGDERPEGFPLDFKRIYETSPPAGDGSDARDWTDWFWFTATTPLPAGARVRPGAGNVARVLLPDGSALIIPPVPSDLVDG